jgi:hypothetical protein
LLSWNCLNAPTAGKSFAQKLPYIAAREDMFNHYTLYDTIHRIGGYTFLNLGAVKPYMSPGLLNPTAMEFYPQGMHYLFAVADIFLRSTTNPGTNFGEYDRFALYNTAVLAVLAAMLVWAARWIAGPGLAGWRRAFRRRGRTRRSRTAHDALLAGLRRARGGTRRAGRRDRRLRSAAAFGA